MKMLMNMKFWLSAVMLMALGITSCIEEGKDYIAGKGTDEFRFSSNEFTVVTFKPFLANQSSALVTIYRDAVSTGSMDKAVTVSLEINSDSLTAYNAANGTTFLETNPAWYTLNIPEGMVTFAPNEGAKTIHITLDTNPFNLALKYAIPFVIKDASSEFSLNKHHSLVIIQTLPINKYDGVYEVTEGSMSDVSAAGATFVHSNTDLTPTYGELQTYGLVTTGASSCAIWDYSVFGNYASPFWTGTGYSGYGSFSAVFTFDSNDKIVSVVNRVGQPAVSNGRYASVDPAAVNQWSPDGIEGCGYRMHHPAVMGGVYNSGSPPDFGSPPRTTWAETWVYKGTR